MTRDLHVDMSRHRGKNIVKNYRQDKKKGATAHAVVDCEGRRYHTQVRGALDRVLHQQRQQVVAQQPEDNHACAHEGKALPLAPRRIELTERDLEERLV